MGSAARFVLLLAAGVAILVVYLRSGESPAVLGLSLVTLLAGLWIWERQPWAAPGGEGDAAGASFRSGRSGAGRAGFDQGWDDAWRCGYDITWDRQGVSGVAVGDRLPGLTIWNRIDRISAGRLRAPADDRGPQRRRGVHLELYRPGRQGPENPIRGDVWLCVGPDQDPEQLAVELTSAWRRIGGQHRGPNQAGGR